MNAAQMRVAALVAMLLPAGPAVPHPDHDPFNAPGHVWLLIELDGAPVEERVTLRFPAPGKLAGEAPCNRYFGANWGEYPWFKAARIGATRRACPALPFETRYLGALPLMDHADASGEHLILTGPGRHAMVFRLMKTGD